MKQKSSAMKFETVSDYLAALASDPNLAVVSITMAASARSVSRSTIEKLLGTDALTLITIGDTRCVKATDLIKAAEKDAADIATVKDELIRRIKFMQKPTAIFYEQVMSPIGLSTGIPIHRKRIGEILGTISGESDSDGGYLISVFVHKKTGGVTKPSPAFFDLAKILGYKWKNDGDFVSEQMAEIWKLVRRK